MKRLVGLLLVGSVVVSVAGCRNTPRRTGAQAPLVAPAPMPVRPAPPPGSFHPGLPPSGPGQAPPFATVPPGTGYPPPGGAVPPFPMVPPSSGQPMPPPSAPPGNSSLAPQNSIAQVENRWQPVPTQPGLSQNAFGQNGLGQHAPSQVQLFAPEPFTGNGKAPSLYPPEKTAEPPPVRSATSLPVGIPQFANAQDNVATGLRPSLDDGLDWLQARGFRSVVHVRLPDENDSADRKQVEKRGLKYNVLEVSPQNLTKKTVEEFSRLVRDTSGQPIFLYDHDGALAGALWYLYFRTTDQLPDDAARIRASSLGLRENRDGVHRDMWLAVQKYLSENNP